jgi:isopentenyldiphosphate isomerase
MKMNYCMECGTALQIKDHGAEGLVPYCEHCAAFRYPVFNTAVSLLVTDEAGEKVILIRQYGRPHYILVAGYVNRGEDAEDAARRELMEELGRRISIGEENNGQLTAQRHIELAHSAADSLERAVDAIESGMPLDTASIDIREALASLSEITGENATEAVIDRVFESFCVGK